MKVTARAHRSGNWWAVDVPEIRGLRTQAKRLDQIPEMVADAAKLFGHKNVTVVIDANLAPAEQAEIRQARELREIARQSEAEAAAATRAAVNLLRNEGLTVRDVATRIGVTPQRVSQLAKAN
jgi:DNA-directed RNA polymerase specialized sigma subunit